MQAPCQIRLKTGHGASIAILFPDSGSGTWRLGRRLAPAVEHRDVDAPVEVAFLENDPVGRVKKIGVEDDYPVRPMLNGLLRVKSGRVAH